MAEALGGFGWPGGPRVGCWLRERQDSGPSGGGGFQDDRGGQLVRDAGGGARKEGLREGGIAVCPPAVRPAQRPVRRGDLHGIQPDAPATG